MKNKNTLSQYVLSVKGVDFDRQLKSRRFVRTGVYAGLAIMLLYAVACILPPVGDDSTNAATKPAVESDTALSINISDPAISLELTPTSANGTFATTSTPINVGVATNNITGYTVGIKASSSSDTATKLINSITECEDTPTSAKCSINTLDDAVSAADYAAVAATELNNTWGYLPSKYNSVANEDYLPAPSNTGDIIEATSVPNAPQPGYAADTTDVSQLAYNEYTIDLGARLDYTPYAGSYTNTFVITAVGNPVPYSVTFEKNMPEQAPATADVDNMPIAQVGTVSSGEEIYLTIRKNVPTMIDSATSASVVYVFAGWCTEPTTEDSTTGYQSCPGATFQPGDYYGIDQTVDSTEVLYAIWGAPAKVVFDGNGLVYNGTAGDTANTIEYIPVYDGGQITGTKTNQKYSGTYAEPAPLDTVDHYIFKGWSTESMATEPTYVNEQDITNVLNLNADDDITLYAVWTYTTVITFNGNGATGGAMEPIVVEAGQTVALPENTFVNGEQPFTAWCTEASGEGGKTYANMGNFTANAGSHDVTLFAQWWTPTSLTFTAGEHIDTLIVVDNSAKFEPYYASSIGNNKSITIATPTEGSEYTITVVPESGYVLSSNASSSSWTRVYDTVDRFDDSTLLTTTYTAGATGDALTVAAALPDDTSESSVYKSYATMQNFATDQCPATSSASPQGINVTDSRDGKSYTVAKFGNYCYMLSNLRLDNTMDDGHGGTTARVLTKLDSDIKESGVTYTDPATGEEVTVTEYTMPTEAWTDGGQNYYCKSIMKHYSQMNGTEYSDEYYYNWYAAMANPYQCESPTASANATIANDALALGSVCPAGWTLPTYNDISANTLWDSGANPGMLATSGRFVSGYQVSVGFRGSFWSSRTYNVTHVYFSDFMGTGLSRSLDTKYYGFSVRCMRAS